MENSSIPQQNQKTAIVYKIELHATTMGCDSFSPI